MMITGTAKAEKNPLMEILETGGGRVTLGKPLSKEEFIALSSRFPHLDPYDEKVYIYREGKGEEVVEGFSGKILSGEEVMPGMELPLEEFKRKK